MEVGQKSGATVNRRNRSLKFENSAAYGLVGG